MFWGVALALGIGAGVLIGVLRSGSPAAVPTSVAPAGPDVSWAAGKLAAPDFSLVDQSGAPVSLGRFRGRPVILTFIDPLCRNLCPTEAKILSAVESRFAAAQRPAIVAVSVNQWGNARHVLLQDVSKWKLPRDWHWAVGPAAKLERVWAAYKIGVSDSPVKVTGVTVHNISHTEAAFLIDPSGHQRALYLYPFRAADVASTVRQLSGATG
jgi:cytochrome oxidase Cu insertion factor (SCO1/SenC/PrrC family)